MSKTFIVVNGVPSWQDEDGLALPIMAGGQEDEEWPEFPTGEAGAPELRFDDLLGRKFLDATTKFVGALKKRVDRRTGRTTYYLADLLDPERGRAQNLSKGGQLIDVNTRQWLDILPGGGDVWTYGPLSFAGKATESDIERILGLDSGGTGSTYHPPAWRPGEYGLEQQALAQRAKELGAQIARDEAELAWAKEEFAKAQAADDRRAMEYAKLQMDMLEMRLDNDRRTLMYSEYGATKRTLIQEKGLARQAALKAGREDPFEQAAILGGEVMRGTSPAQAFGQELRAFIDQPIPEMGMEMTPQEMQGILSVMGGQEAPTVPGPFGMAQGGVIEMEQKDGAFSMKPGKISRLIGEGKHGEGLAAGTAEILTVEKGPFGIKSVEVTPFVGGWAGGGKTWLEQQGGILSAKQALAPLFTGMGMPRVPTAMQHKTTGTTFPFLWGQDFGPFTNRTDFLSEMGVTPQLVRDPNSGKVFYNEDGSLRPFASMADFTKMGFNMADVVNLGGVARGKLGTPGKRMTEAPIVPPSESGGFGGTGGLIIEPTSGIILPAPHKLAGIWDSIPPEKKINIYSAYSSAGIYPEILDATIARATPAAGAFGGRRIGFTGGYM